ncbi:MAG: OmpH family outer membrane protein, partial [Cytophagaceae bacterium]
IPSSKRAEWGYQVGLAEKEYLQYNQTAQEQLQQRQRQLSGQVLTTVNTFIQDYGKNHGYKIILGTTNDGSILYGLDQDDLTSVILEELNKNYKSPLAENKN